MSVGDLAGKRKLPFGVVAGVGVVTCDGPGSVTCCPLSRRMCSVGPDAVICAALCTLVSPVSVG